MNLAPDRRRVCKHGYTALNQHSCRRHVGTEHYITSFAHVHTEPHMVERWHLIEGIGFIPLQLYKVVRGLVRRQESSLRSVYRLVLLILLPGLSDHYPAGEASACLLACLLAVAVGCEFLRYVAYACTALVQPRQLICMLCADYVQQLRRCTVEQEL